MTTGLLTAASLLLVAGGCKKEDANARTFEDSARNVHAAASAGPASADHSAMVYKKAITDLAPIVAEGGGTGAAAASLAAQSGLGVAERAVAKVHEASAEVRTSLASARLNLNSWITRSTAASVTGAFDPAPQIAELEQSRGEIENRIRTLTDEKRNVSGQIESLRQQARAKTDEATRYFAQAADLQSHASTMSASAGLTLVEEAQEAKRRGDAEAMAATTLNSQADVLQPKLQNATLELDLAQNRLTNLNDSAADLEAQRSAAQRAASEARNNAVQYSQQVDFFVEGARKAMTESFESSVAEAERLVNSAMKDASSASQTLPLQGKLVQASGHMTLADVKATAASLTNDYARLLEAVAAAAPAVPNQSEYVAKAREARSQAEAAYAASVEAIESARAAVSSVPAKGPAKEKLDALAAMLERRASGAAGNAADSGAASAAAPGDPSPANGTADDERAIREVLSRLKSLAEAGKSAEVLAMLNARTDAERTLLGNVRSLVEAQGRLDAACTLKLGTSFTDLMKNAGPAGAMLGATDFTKSLAEFDPQSMSILVNGNDAMVTDPSDQTTTPFFKDGGEWKMGLPSAQGMEAMTPMLGALATAFGDMAKDVEDGKLTDAQSLLMALGQKMQGAMGGMGGMPPGMGGGN
ncbi:MAG: hypothetical protein AB7Q00_08505 [Phycisphaerales bacterium]